jgi:hypothetical protein
MGVTHTWFIASDAELAEAAVGWVKPKEPTGAGRRRQGRHAITGEPTVTWEWDAPSSPSHDAEAERVEVGFLPHATTALDPLDFAALLNVLDGLDREYASSLILSLTVKGRPDAEQGVFLVPRAFVALLAAKAGEEPHAIARAWAPFLEPTVEEERSAVEACRRWFRALSELAVLAVESGRGMYVLWEV